MKKFKHFLYIYIFFFNLNKLKISEPDMIVHTIMNRMTFFYLTGIKIRTIGVRRT